MNENPISPEPGSSTSPSENALGQRPPHSPSFGAMFGIGIGLLIISIVLCVLAQNPAPLFLGGLAAFVSLFFEGYRGIFAGYATTVGLVLLVTVIYCSNHPFDA